MEAKEEKNLAEGKLEIDDPLEIEKTDEDNEITQLSTDNEERVSSCLLYTSPSPRD